MVRTQTNYSRKKSVSKKLFPWRDLLVSQKLNQSRQLYYCLFAIAFLLCWNWPLLLATLTFSVTIQLIYRCFNWNWENIFQYWRKLQEGEYRKFTLAVFIGGLASLAVYIVSYIFVSIDNFWLALGIILQGGISLLTCLLLAGQLLLLRRDKNNYQIDKWLGDLTAVEPLKRLIAVNRLISLVEKNRLSQGEIEELTEYFRLMLSYETDSLVKSAIVTGFKGKLTLKNYPPLKIPIELQSQPISLYKIEE